MTDYRNAFRLKLEGDATLTDLLTGGIYDASELPLEQITASNTPQIFEPNRLTLRPFASIRWTATTPIGSVKLHAERHTGDVYWYQDLGYDVINQCLRRFKDLFHNTQLAIPDYTGLAWVEWETDSEDLFAPSLGDRPMRFSRFHMDYTRR